jgi:hypothetical protein
MNIRRPTPDAQYLRSILTYEPDTGNLICKVQRGPLHVGDIAGSIHPNGYHQIGIGRQVFRSHLIIWKMVTGLDTDNPIDHADTDKSNNRWNNLREATVSQNRANTRTPRNNRSGVKGVYWCEKNQRWIATFRKDFKIYHVGSFKSLDEARIAFRKKYSEIHGEYARFE